MEEDKIQLGQKIKSMREYLGFSQGEVAKFLNIPRSAISLIESGSRGVDALELKKLADLYDCSVEYLLSETSSNDPLNDSISLVARATSDLSEQDRLEVLRFAEYIKSKGGKKDDK